MRAFSIVSASLPMTPHCLARLPNMRAPISGAAEGRRIAQIVITITGKMIFSIFDTGLSWDILIFLSFSEVRAFMIGGWITGTRAMYE